MAGFGGGAKPVKKKAGKKAAPKKQLSPKRQWDVYRELVDQGSAKAEVFAQTPDSGKWIPCGEVAVEKAGTLKQAAQMHKRLILEHAVRCNPALSSKAKELVCGIAGADGEPEVLTKEEVPDKLRAGYYGTPDEPSGYYVMYGAASEGFTGSAKKGMRKTFQRGTFALAQLLPS